MIKKSIKGLLCLFYGLLIPLGFAPFNYFFVPLLCFCLLFYQWTNDNPKFAFIHGYLFGFGMFATGVNWLHISINMFGGMNLIGSLLCTYILVAYLAIYPALVGFIAKRYFSSSLHAFLLIAIPLLWVISEWSRAWVFTGFPWLQLGYSQLDSPLRGLFPIGGIYLTSWVMIFLSCLLVYSLRAQTKVKITTYLAFIIIWGICWGLSNKNWIENDSDEISVALIQGAIPQEQKWRPENRQSSFDLYKNLSAPYWDSDLVIWPETAVPAFYHLAPDFMNELTNLANETTTDILVGLPIKDLETEDYFNSAIVFSDNESVYHKRHLVPFGEYLPFDSLTRPFLNFLEIPMSDFSSGAQSKPLVSGRNIDIGISICYEDTFGNEVIQALPEAGILVNISNDAWFGDSLAPHQHLQMARARALETGRYMLRATNTGISAIINERGKIIERSRQFEPDTVHAIVSVFEGKTPYVMLAPIPVMPIIFLILIMLIIREEYKTRKHFNNDISHQ